MSIDLNKMKEIIDKYNKDSEYIANKVVDIIEGKNNLATIEVLSLLIVSLISKIENKDIMVKSTENLVNNLKKFLDKK